MRKLIARAYLILSILVMCVLQVLWIELFQTGNRRGSPLEAQLLLPGLLIIATTLHFRCR